MMDEMKMIQERLALALSGFSRAVRGDARLPAELRASLEAMYQKEVGPALEEYRQLQARTRLPFEITLPGFDGATDETDDRVLWVSADSEDLVRETVAGLGVAVDTLYPVPHCDIDYVLPLQADELRARISGTPPPHPVYDVVDVRVSREARHHAILACMMERHGWHFDALDGSIVLKEFDRVLESGGAGIISVSAQGPMLKATWGWDERSLLLVPVNTTPASVASNADAAAERYVAELRARHGASHAAGAPIDDEPEGPRP